MAEQALNHPDVHASLEKVRREGMTKRMRRDALVDARSLAGTAEDLLDCLARQGTCRVPAGEEPAVRACLTPVASPQKLYWRNYPNPVLRRIRWFYSMIKQMPVSVFPSVAVIWHCWTNSNMIYPAVVCY